MKGAIGKQQEEVVEGGRSRRVSNEHYIHIHSIAPAIQFTLLRMLNTYLFTTEYVDIYTY